ncbi:MAG TPA: reverse transcriptase-like protein [Allosphingosinicella sp.]|jgi:ribonuclease HI
MGGVAAAAPAPRTRRLKVWFDGGCRPNPGRMEAAVVARGVASFFDDLGFGTSGDAEWLALIAALRLAQSLGETHFDLIGDCANVINQANGVWKCRTTAAVGHLARFHDLAASAPPRRMVWTPRAQNLAGIALARRHAR